MLISKATSIVSNIRLLTLLFAFCTVINQCYGQSDQLINRSTGSKKLSNEHSVYAEILGQGGIYSINYDRIYVKKNTPVAFRLGGSAFYSDKVLVFNTPMSVTALIGKQIDYFEVGMGISHLYAIDTYFKDPTEYAMIYVLASPILGYRKQISKGVMFRAVLSPLITVLSSERIDRKAPFYGSLPWIGLAFGYSFPSQKNDN